MKYSRKLFSLVLSVGLILNITGNIGVKANNVDEIVTIKGSNDFVKVHIPPKNWDPIHASKAELNYYGYPSRPEGDKEISNWNKMVSATWVKPEFAISDIKHKPHDTKKSDDINNMVHASSSNWAGFIHTGTSYGSGGHWLVPSVSTPTLQRGYSSQWVGIGGGNSTSKTLAQIGTSAQSGLVSNSYYPWFEIYGSNAINNGYEVKITNFSVSPGDKMYGVVQIQSIANSNVTFWFYLVDETKGTSTSFSKIVSITDNVGVNQTAEWISENVDYLYPKTVTNGSSVVSFLQCKYERGLNSDWTTLSDSDSSISECDMYSSSNSRYMALPGNISSGNFDISWMNYN
ncbi:MAG: G1 family glutamic endopeptidase [Clostridiaceae bacterium]